MIVAELMRKCYMINTPWVFHGVWYVVRGMLAAKTVAKVAVMGHSFQEELHKEIAPEYIPSKTATTPLHCSVFIFLFIYNDHFSLCVFTCQRSSEGRTQGTWSTRRSPSTRTTSCLRRRRSLLLPPLPILRLRRRYRYWKVAPWRTTRKSPQQCRAGSACMWRTATVFNDGG